MTKDEWYRQLFDRLDNSKFRSSFHLKQKDIDYINKKGLETIRQHAKDFITKREAPAYIANDGKQTPMRGHPVFIAQHATATCCRECIRKWHKMQPGKELSQVQQDYGVAAMALGKGAYAIHQSGKWYTNENIDQMLMERHLNKKARRCSHKHHMKGPRKRTEEDDVRFAQSFEKLILMFHFCVGKTSGKTSVLHVDFDCIILDAWSAKLLLMKTTLEIQKYGKI